MYLSPEYIKRFISGTRLVCEYEHQEFGKHVMISTICSISKDGFRAEIPFMCSNGKIATIVEYIRYSRYNNWMKGFVFEGKESNGKYQSEYFIKFKLREL